MSSEIKQFPLLTDSQVISEIVSGLPVGIITKEGALVTLDPDGGISLYSSVAEFETLARKRIE